MCSITGSFSTDKIVELAKLNEYRGTYSHSITYIHRYTMSILSVSRGEGPLLYDTIRVPDDHYCIVHQQAPTTDKSLDNIHPASIGNHLLWHNGIIKEKEIKRLQSKHESTYNWDTKLILRQLIDDDTPDNIDGTFSCVWYDGSDILVFRNEISPLFIDDELNISSTKFDGSSSIEPNIMFTLGTSHPKHNLPILEPVGEFSTVENPYYFGE